MSSTLNDAKQFSPAFEIVASLSDLHLRTHLKTHSGEKSNIYNQWNYVLSQETNEGLNCATFYDAKQFSPAFEISRLAVWLIFEDSFENAQRRKAKQK